MTFVALLAVGSVVAAGLAWRRSFPRARRRSNWLTLAWPIVIIGPALQFTTTRDPLAAARGDVAVENYIEVVIVFIIGGWAVSELRSRPGWWRIPMPLVGFAAFALLSMASA